MPKRINKKKVAKKELDEVLSSKRLAEIFDVLEPRAARLSKQPSSVVFGVFGGAFFLFLGILFSSFGESVFHLSIFMIWTAICALSVSGIALGVLMSTGIRGLRLEKRGRAIEKFFGPVIRVFKELDGNEATKPLCEELKASVIRELDQGRFKTISVLPPKKEEPEPLRLDAPPADKNP